MAVKATVLGMIVYGAMVAYFLAFVTLACRRQRAGGALYFLGFLTSLAALGVRWRQVGHVPMQNLFEVFLCLGALVYPVTVFCRRFFRVGGESADALIGCIVLFPAGFVFNAAPRRLPPALQCWLFAPHVASYMFAYMVLAKAGVQALGQLFIGESGDGSRVSYEVGTYKVVRLGFPLLTVGLLLGAWWGKVAWGDYWNWDPKELWSLVSWLVYVGYLHFRTMFGRKYARVNSAMAVGGLAAIVITLLWVNLSRIFAGLHSYAI